MIGLRQIQLVIGLLLSTLALSMLLPAAVDALAGSPDWQVFFASAAVSLFAGLALVLGNRAGRLRLSLRQAFLLGTLSWTATAAVGALPFAFSELDMSPTDAFFEAMSGVTTTGSTVIADLSKAPPGILLWRALLQWLGGIGAIVMAVAVLPALKIGGMEIFRLEGGEPSEQVMPRAARVTSSITLIYVALTGLVALLLWLAGMSGFEALVHGMTTVSTGGFSTSDQSIGPYGAPVQVVLIFAMMLGALPFIIYLQALQGNPRALARDGQVRWYLTFLLAGGWAVSLWLWASADLTAADSLLHGFFTVVSVSTGTGFYTVDFGDWAGLPLAVLFFLGLVGGCAGSTAAGIKVFRLQILFANANAQAARLLSPNTVVIPLYNRKPISDSVAESVMGFLFVYALTVAVLAMGLSMLGLDFVTALSAAASAIGNVGPGLGGIVGPTGDYSSLPDLAKWLLAAGMLLGRLEMFVVLVLFVPGFWKS